MPPSYDTDPLPDWANDGSLRETARKNFGVGADADLPDNVRFRVGVTRVIRERLGQGQSKETEPAIFFLLSGGSAAVADLNLKREPMLDSGRAVIEGKFWFVGPLAIAGHGLAHDDWSDDDAVFNRAVQELGLGEVPAILWETRLTQPAARFFPSGLGEPERYELLRLGGDDLTIDDVLEVVDRIHGQCLISPTVQLAPGKLWKKASDFVPIKNAEAQVQLQIRNGLVGAFPSCVVRAEQTQATGRLDLEIEEPSDAEPHGFVRHALLELKVLRAVGSTGKKVSAQVVKDAIAEGVTQAAQYRDERGTKASALCCFDMRKTVVGDKCFADVRRRARARKVHLRVWHIFPSATALREHGERSTKPKPRRAR
jgi:hypothetical protein